MSSAPPVSAGTLYALARAGALSPAALARARVLAGLQPTAADWRTLVARLFALGGGLLLGAGVIFFIAFNWAALDRFTKFALVAGAMAAAALVALWRSEGLAARAALLLAQLLLGGLLALFGQTYQTGADPYQLFLVWGLLALPWTIASGWAGSWGLLLLLANLATVLYFVELRLGALLFDGDWEMLAAVAAVNGAGLGLAELACRLPGFDRWRVLPRLAGLALCSALCLLMMIAIFSNERVAGGLTAAGMAAGGVVIGLLLVYGRSRHDLFIVAWGCLALIASVESFLVNLLFDRRFGGGEGSLLLSGLALIGMSAAAAAWIRALARQPVAPGQGGAA